MNTLKDYEINDLNTWTLSIQNGSCCWNEPDNVQKLKDTLFSLVEETTKKLPTLCVLRAIVVTSNVIEEYDRLLSGTIRKARVNIPREGFLAGKVLTWGDSSNIDSYYAAIVIDEGICASATFEDNSEAKALIVHELAHVAEGYITRNSMGEVKEDIYCHEWGKVKLSNATSVFSEYFAQIVSYSYYQKQDILEMNIHFIVDQLESVTDYLNKEILQYRTHANIGYLWSIAISELSRVFAQIGRSVGLLVCLSTEKYELEWKNIIDKIESVNPLWVPVINEFRDALATLDLEAINVNTFTSICDAIEHGYNAAGLKPEIRQDGSLYINVPFRGDL